jgi:hypothetical protein
LRAAVAAAIARMLADVRGIAAQQLELLALEARKAVRDLITMAALGAASGVLLALAWGGFTVAFALWLLEMGMRISLAVLLASGLNLLAALAALQAMWKRWNAPQFPATLQTLGLSPPGERDAAP